MAYPKKMSPSFLHSSSIYVILIKKLYELKKFSLNARVRPTSHPDRMSMSLYEWIVGDCMSALNLSELVPNFVT